MEQCPDPFKEHPLRESRQLLRKEVFQAWKFQRTMDVCAGGCLNCEAMNNIGSGVEELPKSAVGVTPAGSTVARNATPLEDHAANEHGLHTLESSTSYGPSMSFDFDTLL